MKKNNGYEHWLNSKWRPMAAWCYILMCVFDFILSPIIFFWFQYMTGQPITQWFPVTLHGAGIVHMSFGAIVGITAWNRTIEKTKIGLGGKREEDDDFGNRYNTPRYRSSGRYEHPYEDR